MRVYGNPLIKTQPDDAGSGAGIRAKNKPLLCSRGESGKEVPEAEETRPRDEA
jgi:hypothetical protein